MTTDSGIRFLSAVLTPVVAIAAIVFALLNYLHARRVRKDALFDRRYAFYSRVRDIWLSSGNGAADDEDPELYFEDLVQIAEEARLLFGKDIEKHILSLAGKGHTGSPFFPDSAFTAPFEKYLRF